MTGLYLNTNVSSVQSQNYLRRNMSELSNVLTRLSTGLRINSGKDDPAGMIASELIRSDITGATMAIRNTQRANSVIAIAESALGQVSSMLNDIRGLVNEAANSAAMSSDMIAANQLQIDATLDSIDRIARTTNFMGKKILDGSLDFVTANQQSGQLDTLRIDAANFGNAASINVNIDVIKTAASAKLYFNQGGISQQTVLEIGGNYGAEIFNFQAGASIEDIARGVNLVTDATGVRAVLGKDATQGQLLVTSAGGGVHNDINIRAIDAGFAAGNYSVKFSAGTSTGSNYVITPPSYNAPGVIDIQLQMEEARGASAHAVNEYFNIKANQAGTMFDNTDVIFLQDNTASTTLASGAVVNAAASFEKGPRAATGTLVEIGAGLNTLHISAATAGTAFNNVDIQYVVDGTLATAAGASYDPNAKLLTIAVRDANTTYADVAEALKNNTDFRLNKVTTTGGSGVNVNFDTRIVGATSQLVQNVIGATGTTMGTDSNALVVRYIDGTTTLQEITAAINAYQGTDPLGQTGSLFTAELAHSADANLVVRTQTADATIKLGAFPYTDETFSFDYSRMSTSSGKPVNGLLDGMKIELFDGTAPNTTAGDRYDYAANTVYIDINATPPITSSGVLAKHIEAALDGQRIKGQLAGETLSVASGAVMIANPRVSTATLTINTVSTTFTFDYATAASKITTSTGAPANGILDGMKVELSNTGGDRYDYANNTVFIDIVTTPPVPATSAGLAARLENVLDGKRIAGQPAGATVNVPANSIRAVPAGTTVVAGDVGANATAVSVAPTSTTILSLDNANTATPITFTFNYGGATPITTSSGASAVGILDGITIQLFDGLDPLNTPGHRYDLNTNTVFIDIGSVGTPTTAALLATAIESTLDGKHIAGQLPGETINLFAGSIAASVPATLVDVLDVQIKYANSGIAVATAADTGKFTYINTGVATKFQGNTTFSKALQDGNCGYVSALTANQVIDFINSSEELSRLIQAENAFGSTGTAKVTLFDETAYYGDPNAGNALQFLGPKGAPNIIFTADAVNQPLSLGFIPAEVAQPVGNLVSTNANASITLTSFQQGSQYDDVVVRFKAAEPGTGNSVTFTDCPSSAMAYISLDPNKKFGSNSQFIVTAKTPGVDYNMTDIVFRLDLSQSAAAVASYDKESNKLIVTVNTNSGTPYSNPPAVTTNDVIAAINRTSEFAAELDHTGYVAGTSNNGSGYVSQLFPSTDATATIAITGGNAKITFSKTIKDSNGNSAIALLNDMNVAIGGNDANVTYNIATHTLTIGQTATDANIATAMNTFRIKGMPVGTTLSSVAPADITRTGWMTAYDVNDVGKNGYTKVGTTNTELTVGNTGSTGGHVGVVEIRLETNADGDSILTSDEIVDMINADTVVNRIFSAKNYLGSTGEGLINIHGDTIRNVTGGSGVSYPASVMTTSGGVKGEDLLEVKLATDKYGNVITTARDLVEFMNTLDAEVTRGISVSLVRPQGVDNLLRTWTTDECGNIIEQQACIDDAGWGLLKPTSYRDECNNLYLTPIIFASQGENILPTTPSAEIVAVNGIDASFRLYGKIPGTEYEGVTMQYFITQGGSDNPPRAEYDAATKKLTVFVTAGTTAAGVADLIHTSEQTKNLFKVEQLGTGSAAIHEADDAVKLKNGTYNAGYRGGARLLWNADADAHKLVFESINKGADQRVDVRVINGVPFDVYNEAGIKTTRDFGDDMTARLNGLTMVSRGNTVSINTAMLSMTMNVSDNVQAGDTISFDIVSGGATFQIGPDVVSMQQLRLGIQSVSTARLGGAAGLLMQLRDGENASLTNNTKLADLIVQEAINAVAVLRGRLGTTQKCTLDPNMTVLQDTLVEMSAAEAQISNADFAEESSRLTRTQILVQAGAKTLQIANQLPQYAAMLMG